MEQIRNFDQLLQAALAHGRKGIAVAVGCLFVTFGWQGACLELAIFAVLVLATKYVSAGSIAAAAACPLFAAYYFLYATFAPAAWVCTTVAALTVRPSTV